MTKKMTRKILFAVGLILAVAGTVMTQGKMAFIIPCIIELNRWASGYDEYDEMIEPISGFRIFMNAFTRLGISVISFTISMVALFLNKQVLFGVIMIAGIIYYGIKLYDVVVGYWTIRKMTNEYRMQN